MKEIESMMVHYLEEFVSGFFEDVLYLHYEHDV
jgi:hypothetical protein